MWFIYSLLFIDKIVNSNKNMPDSTGNQLSIVAVTIFVTALLVELVGYWWHRCAAHLGYAGDVIRKTHHKHHEIDYPHHDMVSEEYRVDTFWQGDTWPWFIPTVAFYIGIYILWKLGYMSDFVTGIAAIWVPFHIWAISYIHDSYHVKGHWLARYEWYQQNKKFHDIHHYYNANYGISNYNMDRIFGTLVGEYDKSKTKQNIFPGFK